MFAPPLRPFNLVRWVGHSYGGVVVRHVADRMPDRIRSLIYFDAFVPENGKTLFDYLPDNGEGDRKLAVAHADGWRVPPRPASFFAVNAADAAWVDRQCTMHPLSSFEAPAQIRSACDGIASIGYFLARGYDGPFGQFYAKAGERRWWREELACGHDVMLDMPNELTAPAAAVVESCRRHRSLKPRRCLQVSLTGTDPISISTVTKQFDCEM